MTVAQMSSVRLTVCPACLLFFSGYELFHCSNDFAPRCGSYVTSHKNLLRSLIYVALVKICLLYLHLCQLTQTTFVYYYYYYYLFTTGLW